MLTEMRQVTSLRLSFTGYLYVTEIILRRKEKNVKSFKMGQNITFIYLFRFHSLQLGRYESLLMELGQHSVLLFLYRKKKIGIMIIIFLLHYYDELIK